METSHCYWLYQVLFLSGLSEGQVRDTKLVTLYVQVEADSPRNMTLIISLGLTNPGSISSLWEQVSDFICCSSCVKWSDHKVKAILADVSDWKSLWEKNWISAL